MALPGTSSGVYTWAPSNYALVMESFDRCLMPPPMVERHHLISARYSLNAELSDWANQGFPLWKIISGTINLVPAVGTYAIDQSIETLTEVYYSQINGDGAGQNNDRIMVPLTRTQYAMIPNKQTQGTPTQYWLQMLATPQVTLWQVPQVGAPNYVVSWYGLQRMQDANLGSGETPDIVYRAYEALTAKMAMRLWTKFGFKASGGNAQLYTMHRGILKEEAENAWNNFQTRDQEIGPLKIQPGVGVYGRID